MGTSRRNVLVAGLTAPLARAWQRSPNDQIRLAFIGAGGRARDLIAELGKAGENVTIAAVCDVWRPNRESFAALAADKFGTAPKQTTRYQEVLAMRDVDAVLIATPDFTHPKILADAIAAGKDAYVEKPFAVNFADAKMAYQAVKASKQVVQVGTQRRSDPGLIGIARTIQAGTIGKVTRAAMEVHFQEARWRRDYHTVQAEDVDWEAFQFGGRISGPFDARKLREWQLFRETTSGIPGLWMCHLIDLAAWFLNDPYPTRTVSLGGVYLWKDGRQTSDVFQALVEYGDCLVTFAMSLTNAAGNRNLWFGTLGTIDADALTMSGEGSRDPRRLLEKSPIEKVPVDSHMSNFLKCLRSRETPRASVDAGFHHAVAGCMAAMSLETSRCMRFDRERLQIV